MRLVGLALAAGVGLTASIAAYAVPLEGQTGPAATGPAPGVVRVWGECGGGKAVGFRRIAPRTTTATGAATTVVGADPMEPGPAMAGGNRAPMEIGITTTMTDRRFLRRIEDACESLGEGLRREIDPQRARPASLTPRNVRGS